MKRHQGQLETALKMSLKTSVTINLLTPSMI